MKKINFLTYHKSLNRDGLCLGVGGTFVPHLVFDYIFTTHQFNPSPYYKELSIDRMKSHTEIMKLHNKGWGYTKIHHHLIKNGFDIGKSRTTVHSIIKKMEKRDEFYHQPIMDGYGNFRVEWREG